MTSAPVQLHNPSGGSLHAGGVSGQEAEIIPLPNSRPPAPEATAKPFAKATDGIVEKLRATIKAIVPTLLMLVVLLTVWEVSCSSEGASLPSPSRVWSESHDVIVHPLKGVSLDSSGLHV